MQNEITRIIDSVNDSYKGSPWFGRSFKELLAEIEPEEAMQKPNGQHSILELLCHMSTWRSFTISRLKPAKGKTSDYFGKMDWQKLDHTDISLWKKSLQEFEDLQDQLLDLINRMDEAQLNEIVAERKYDFRFLLNGVIQHDIYHIGQIAYIKKML